MLTDSEVMSWDRQRYRSEIKRRVNRMKQLTDKGPFKCTPAENDELRELNAEMTVIDRNDGFLGDRRMVHPGSGGGTKELKDAAAIANTQSLEEWVRSKGRVKREEDQLHLGRYVKGLVTGSWDRAEKERKAMSLGVLSDGGHLVPEPLSARVIDMARNRARVVAAGAFTVPMTAATLKVARQIGDASGTWHAELADDIGESQLEFDAVELRARTLTALVKFSRELFEDVPDDQLEQRVRGSIAEALALELDRVSLYGDNVTNPQEPTGLRNVSGITVQTFNPPDGGAPADYNFLLDAYFELESVNFEATASILNPRDEKTLAGLTDSTGQPLRAPDAVAAVRRLRTNQVSTSETTGVNNDTSAVFVGSWPELLIGMRTQLQLQLLTERYAESGTLALLAWMRADVAVAREDAFVIAEGLRAA